jgi:hypothetical protein
MSKLWKMKKMVKNNLLVNLRRNVSLEINKRRISIRRIILDVINEINQINIQKSINKNIIEQ